jgi:hypothetical protein
MRKIPLFLLLLLTMQTTFAASLSPQPATTKLADSKPPKSWMHRGTAVGHTMAKVGGALAGICLGPIGYLGIHLCTHDQDTRDCAARGFKVWAFFACIADVSYLAYLTKSNPGSMDFLDQLFMDTN